MSVFSLFKTRLLQAGWARCGSRRYLGGGGAGVWGVLLNDCFLGGRDMSRLLGREGANLFGLVPGMGRRAFAVAGRSSYRSAGVCVKTGSSLPESVS